MQIDYKESMRGAVIVSVFIGLFFLNWTAFVICAASVATQKVDGSPKNSLLRLRNALLITILFTFLSLGRSAVAETAIVELPWMAAVIFAASLATQAIDESIQTVRERISLAGVMALLFTPVAFGYFQLGGGEENQFY